MVRAGIDAGDRSPGPRSATAQPGLSTEEPQLPDESRSPLARFAWTVDLGFAALLVVCAVRYYSIHPLAGTGLIVLGLVIACGVAYAFGALGKSSPARNRAGVLIATAIWFPLVLLAPSFGWTAFALFFAVHRVLPRGLSQLLSAAIVAAVCAGMYILSRGQDLGLVLGPLLGGLVLAVSFAQLDQALENRRRLIRTLVETRSQLARTERESGALAERTRVASELHDTVVQQTATALLLLEAATETPARIDEARDVLRASLSETRHLMHGLTSALVSEGSLVAALRDLSAEHAAAFVVVGEERPLPEATAHALLRVSQEALTNAAKHADAPRTAVTLTFFDGLVGVDIADNGAGFDPAARAGASDTGLDSPELAGYGLRAMAWRVESLGGTFTLETAPGSGTVIAAVIPDGTAATAPENGARR